ncbi:MAG: Rieske (2Fe-2S) protein [Spirochaetaceae bacterium]|nr:Rieske (2Fe-2S) protein [Spirochaetaceae bacterium]
MAAFPDGSVRPVVVGRRSLVVVHHAGCWHALRDRCPHQGAPLSRGRIVEQACAHLEEGRPVFGDAVPVLQCPWHGWSFLLADGLLAAATSVATATARVRSYPVRVVAGRVTIELPQ